MDACRASSCCHGVKNAPWTEVPVVPSARATRAVPVPVPAAVAVVAVPLPARGVPQRRWRLWISSLQRRLMRLSIRWTNEPLLHSTTNRSIFSTGSPLTGEFCARCAEGTKRDIYDTFACFQYDTARNAANDPIANKFSPLDDHRPHSEMRRKKCVQVLKCTGVH